MARLRFLARSLMRVCMVLGMALPAFANTPEELIRWVYQSELAPGGGAQGGLYFLSSAQNRRAYLSTRLADFYDANDSYGDDLYMGCIDFHPTIPGQDYEPSEIASTLQISSQSDAQHWRVTARFRSYGASNQVVYIFVPEGGTWKLDDIDMGGNKLSDIPCAPRGDTASFLRGTGYCYVWNNSTLVLDIGGTGVGEVMVESWQPTGHSCFMEETVRPIQGGWTLNNPSYNPNCRMNFLVGSDGGITLSGQGCQLGYCGAAATLEGLVFPGQSQVRCVNMPG